MRGAPAELESETLGPDCATQVGAANKVSDTKGFDYSALHKWSIDNIEEFWNEVWDDANIIGIKGTVFKTKVGEISVKVKEFTVLTKSLRPLPLPKEDVDGIIHDSFTDPEKRYRQRYVDLVVNPEVKNTFIKRTKLTNSMREFLNKKEYLCN